MIPWTQFMSLRLLGEALGARRRRRASRQPVIRPWREDWLRSYPTVGLTPGRALAILQAADAGAPATQFELFDEMLQKWPRLAAVEATRRLALTGLEWEVLPPPIADAPRAARRAEAAAAYCRDALLGLDRFSEALDHLASALGHGVSVVELIWERSRLIDLVPVPGPRIVSDPNEPWRLRVRTEDEPVYGVALDEQPLKWLVHRPRSRPGRNFDGGLLRASVLLYVAQSLSFKDWLIYSQVAGMPVRVARFEPGTPEADKQQLLKMLEALGTDAVAAVSKNVELQMLESTRGGDKPYLPLQDYCNTEVTILWLGQHLTTDVRQTGSRAAAEIHDRVREDLLVDDIADEGQSLRRDVLRPLVLARFDDATPVPMFRRSLIQSFDSARLATTLSAAVHELGLRVPRRWAHRALGIPEATSDEPTLAPRVSP